MQISAPAGRLVNRELSWLEFNARVLEEALDPTVPLLERVRFLSIFSSNLDEFFMVRVAGVWRQIDAGVHVPGPDGLTPREVLDAISRRANELVSTQHRAFLDMLPELAAAGVHVLRREELDAEQRAAVATIFARDVLPLLTPMAIDPGHPFPYLANRALCVIAELEPREDADALLPSARECVIHIPAGVLPRFIRLPSAPGTWVFLPLEDVVKANLGRLFSGSRVRSSATIRVTRDAELDLVEEAAEDLLSTIEDAVRNRRMGAAVRLQYERGISPTLLDRLRAELELDAADLYATDGPTGLTDLAQLNSQLDLPALREPPHVPVCHPAFAAGADPFAVIRAGDVLVHHPYEDFDCVVRFIRAAAEDPDVVAIKMTLYRVSPDSPIAQSLELAARLGKQVAVLVELRARFSEEGNIAWARKLEATGAHVVYGIPGYKTHCKVALVVRREGGGVCRYVHLGTGNYNHITARFYTDYSLFTADETTGEDATHLFHLLTGYVRPPAFKRLVVAPQHLREWLVARIRREAAHARAGRPARIFAKLNSLADPALIEELYAASAAGVEIDLVVRGICCLRPGVAGLSEHIRVRRVVDHFLEHARVLSFANGGRSEWWMSSADWMPRNLGGRIEVTFPIRGRALRRPLERAMALQLADNVKASEVLGDGRSRRVRPAPGEAPVRCQERLVEEARRR